MASKAKADSAEPEPLLERMREIWGAVPGGQGFYCKVYKQTEGSKWPGSILETLTEPETVEDWEIFLQDLARERRWGSGLYRLCMGQRGKKGFAKGFPHLEISLLFPDEVSPAHPTGEGWPVIRTGLGIVKETAEAMEKLGVGAQRTSMTDVGKLLVEGIQTGMKMSEGQVAAQSAMASANAQLSSTLVSMAQAQANASKAAPDFVEQLDRAQKVGIIPKLTEGNSVVEEAPPPIRLPS